MAEINVMTHKFRKTINFYLLLSFEIYNILQEKHKFLNL